MNKEHTEIQLIKALQMISMLLDNLKYERCGRECTLHEDEMGFVFYCRDLADEALREHKERNGMD